MFFLRLKNKSVNVAFGFGILLALGLSACGEEEKRANQASHWLKTYSSANPPNDEWVMTNVAVDDKGQIVMDVLVPDQGQVDLIKSRTHIEQAHIVLMACPPLTAKIWIILSTSQVLWVNLLEKTDGGLYKPITGASCRPAT